MDTPRHYRLGSAAEFEESGSAVGKLAWNKDAPGLELRMRTLFHTDPTDRVGCCLFPFGNFKCCYVLLPQLGVRVLLRSRAALWFQSGALWHSSTPPENGCRSVVVAAQGVWEQGEEHSLRSFYQVQQWASSPLAQWPEALRAAISGVIPQ